MPAVREWLISWGLHSSEAPVLMSARSWLHIVFKYLLSLLNLPPFNFIHHPSLSLERLIESWFLFSVNTCRLIFVPLHICTMSILYQGNTHFQIEGIGNCKVLNFVIFYLNSGKESISQLYMNRFRPAGEYLQSVFVHKLFKCVTVLGKYAFVTLLQITIAPAYKALMMRLHCVLL